MDFKGMGKLTGRTVTVYGHLSSAPGVGKTAIEPQKGNYCLKTSHSRYTKPLERDQSERRHSNVIKLFLDHNTTQNGKVYMKENHLIRLEYLQMYNLTRVRI